MSEEPLFIDPHDIQEAEKALGYPEATSPQQQHEINKKIVEAASGIALQREEELFGRPNSDHDANSEKDRK